MSNLRLNIEPIPNKSRLASLAKLLPQQQWDRIRRSVYRRVAYHCSACGRHERLQCHEVWQYDKHTGCQWLRGFQALCRDCHDAKHILFVHDAQKRERLLQHIAIVNRLTRCQAEEQYKTARRFQNWLDHREWTVIYGAFTWQMPALHGISQRQAYVRHMAHAQCR